MFTIYSGGVESPTSTTSNSEEESKIKFLLSHVPVIKTVY